MSYKKIFCSFADSLMFRSLDRIKRQAISMNVYDEIYIYNETNLDEEFKKKFENYLIPSRGYGYWVWKPQIIKQIMKNMDFGDILQYTDAGCHLNKKGVARLNEYFELTNLSPCGILGFESKEPIDKRLNKDLSLLEKHWTKGDLFDYFEVRDNEAIYNSEQIGSGIIFIKKTEQSLNLINDWAKVYSDNFSLADDTPSKSDNFEGFIEHRHDQSIFSILGRIYNITTLSSFEYYQKDFSKLRNYPILALRDKDKDGNIKNRIKYFLRKYISYV